MSETHCQEQTGPASLSARSATLAATEPSWVAAPWLVASVLTRAFAQSFGLVIGHADAAVAATVISTRGLRTLHRSSVRLLEMSAEDGHRSARALTYRWTPADALPLAVDLARLRLGRAAVLATMAMEVAEESAYPLVRRMDATMAGIAQRTSA